MRTLSAEESALWFMRGGLTDMSRHQLTPGVSAAVCRNLEDDDRPAMRTYWRAGVMAEWLWEHQPEQVVVQVTEWGIWESSENPALYYAWRRHLGSKSLLDDEPGHLFLVGEKSHVVSLIQMAMIFGWGVAAGTNEGDALLMFDHDGHTHAVSRVKSRAEKLAEWLAK